jgi:hypothetical protein
MHRIKTFITVFVTFCLLVPATAHWRLDGIVPVVITMPPAATAGSSVWITVETNQPGDGVAALSITATQRNFFSSIPTSVTVPYGATTVGFEGTVSSSATGTVTVTAQTNGGSVYALMAVTAK